MILDDGEAGTFHNPLDDSSFTVKDVFVDVLTAHRSMLQYNIEEKSSIQTKYSLLPFI